LQNTRVVSKQEIIKASFFKKIALLHPMPFSYELATKKWKADFD
jgi:hypothetical protein